MAPSVDTNVTKSTTYHKKIGRGRAMSDNRTQRLRQRLFIYRQDIQRQIDESLARYRVTQAQLREESGADAEDMSFCDSQNHQAYSVFEVWNNKRNLLDAALRRLDDGTYGLCEDCLTPISEERLKALPFVRRCIECQRHVELLEQIAKKEARSNI